MVGSILVVFSRATTPSSQSSFSPLLFAFVVRAFYRRVDVGPSGAGSLKEKRFFTFVKCLQERPVNAHFV
jgi:hypothetical protein